MFVGKKILVVDDEKKILEVVRAYLEREGYTVFTAADGQSALEAADRGHPDLIILDLMLPDLSGEEVCQRLRQESEVPILMLTAKSDEEERVKGLSIGADDYLVKPFSPRELTARVRAILRRSKGEALKDVLSFDGGHLVIDTVRHEASKEGNLLTLTPLEFRLLMTLAQYPGRAYTRLEIIRKVQGYDFEGYERTVDTHIKNLRYKIEKDPKNPEYMQTIYGVGYKFVGKPDVQ